MIILGIDPGLATTGFGVIEVAGNRVHCRGFGGISSKGKEPLSIRLNKIYDGVREAVETYQPEHCAIEDVFYHENVNTAIVMGHARGVAMLAAQQSGVTVFEYAAREVKMSTVGNGAASKKQVQAMVQRLLALKALPKPQDAADALAVALCHHHRIKFRMLKTAAK